MVLIVDDVLIAMAAAQAAAAATAATTAAAGTTAAAAAGTTAAAAVPAAAAAAAPVAGVGTAAGVTTTAGELAAVGAVNPTITTAVAAAPSGAVAPVGAAVPGVAASPTASLGPLAPELAGPSSTLQSLGLPEATGGFQAGDAGINIDTAINAAQNVQPTFLDKLGEFGTKLGKRALVGAGTNAAVNAAIPGPERGKRAAIGAAAGAIGGGIQGGASAISDPSLGMEQAIANLGSQPSGAEGFGDFGRDVLFGDDPAGQIFGGLSRNEQPGILPGIAKNLKFALPFNTQTKNATIRRRRQRRRNPNDGFASLLFRR